MPSAIRNFGKNVLIRPKEVLYPESVEELLRLMASYPGSKFRAIGSLHSWSKVTQTTDVLLNLKHFDSIEITKHGTVLVGGGCQIKKLLAFLAKSGKTLPSVGLIAEQTVAGATATGTHGSGRNSLSHYIRSVTIAHFDSNGQPIVSTVDSGPDLQAARCSLGLMGVIVKVEFEIRAEYCIEEHAAHYMTLDEVLDQEPTYPLQQFYLIPWSWNYFAHHRRETDSPPQRFAWAYAVYRLIIVDVLLHIVVTFLARYFRFKWAVCFFYRFVLPFSIIRNWKVSDRSNNHLVMNHQWFLHIEIELFVKRDHLPDAMDFLKRVLNIYADRNQSVNGILDQRDSADLAEKLKRESGSYCHHFPICIRRVLQDETLISMTCDNEANDDGDASSVNSGQQDWYAISLISYSAPSDRQGFFGFADFIGRSFARLFSGRCHWGKYNRLDSDTNFRIYPRLDSFRSIIQRFDPDGRFQNMWLSEIFGSESPPIESP